MPVLRANEYRMGAESMSDKVCLVCKGSGYPPERWMGDPEGQKPCKACGGSGRTRAA